MGKLAAPVRADKEMMFTNRQLVALMWPLLLEQLLAITVGLADSLMVATVGDAAISAVSLVDSISNLMIYIFSAMATGGAKRSACLARIFFRMFICVRLLLILPSVLCPQGIRTDGFLYFRCRFRYSFGVKPVTFLNVLKKYFSS